MKNEVCFLDATRCDMFSNLRGIDLQELLIEIENFYLEYRNTLNLPSNVTFGTELEYENLSVKIASEYIKKNYPFWDSKLDGSCQSGGEISSPVLTDNITTWKSLKDICWFLKEKKVVTSQNAGGHIHIGAHILGKDAKKWVQFLKTYVAFENIIFRFSYGDKISARKNLLKYAPPIADELFRKIPKINTESSIADIAYQLLLFTKRQALNFTNIDFTYILDYFGKNTLEFRCPNATIEEVVWQNNINAFTKLVLSPNKPTFDEEFINFKFKNERISSGEEFYLYSEVHLKSALEFVDLVFDNNLDKIYFLRQYLKDFETSYGTKEAQKSKKFIK